MGTSLPINQRLNSSYYLRRLAFMELIPLSKKIKQATPLSMIMDIENHNSIRLWLLFAGTSRLTIHGYKATLYDFTYQKLSDRTGLSLSCCHKHLKTLLDKGHLYLRNGNLCMKGINRYREPKVLIPIHYKNKSKQTLELRNAVIQNNLNAQKKQIDKKKDIVTRLNTEYGKLSKEQIKYLNKNPNILLEINPTTLSNKKFGSLIYRSISTGKRIQKALNKANMIQSISRHKVLVKDATLTDYYHYIQVFSLPSIRYVRGIGIVQQLSNEIRRQALVGV